MKYNFYIFAACLLVWPAVWSSAARAGSADSKVHAVLFFSPVCPHCQKVITEVVQPLVTRYFGQLDVTGVNTTLPDGKALFDSAIQAFNIPEGRRGVPVIIISNDVLVGPEEIGAAFPALVNTLFEKGGAELPPIPGLREQMARDKAQAARTGDQGAGGSTAPSPAVAPPHAQELSIWGRLARDPVGNSIAIAILAGMLIVLGVVVLRLRRSTENMFSAGHDRLIPALSATGLAIAGYLAYVGFAQAATICGPVGDCNMVQQSPYARLFGTVPVSILGVAGYLAMICAWALARYGRGRTVRAASSALLAAAFVGTIISIYLTFLEPFVIGATCLWCLMSAALMTGVLWCSADRFRSVALFTDPTGFAGTSSKQPDSIRPSRPRAGERQG